MVEVEGRNPERCGPVLKEIGPDVARWRSGDDEWRGIGDWPSRNRPPPGKTGCPGPVGAELPYSATMPDRLRPRRNAIDAFLGL